MQIAYIFKTMSMDIAATITAEVGDCRRNSVLANITASVIPKAVQRMASMPMKVDQ